MKTFAIDTSTSFGNVAVVAMTNGHTSVLAESGWRRKKAHSEIVTQAMDHCLEAAGVKLDDMDFFSVGVGPGSFTGLRVGVNLIRSLSYAHDKPVQPVNSLRALAEPALGLQKPVLCGVNAFKNMIYLAAYEAPAAREIIAPTAIPVHELDQWVSREFIFAGNALEVYDSVIPVNVQSRLHRFPFVYDEPRASAVGKVTLQDFRQDTLVEWKEVKPLYIRHSEAEEKLKQPATREGLTQ